MKQRIGYIGLGNIGKPMAVNLLRAGYHVTAHDLRPERLAGLEDLGARIGDSALAVAEQSDLVAIAVVDDEQLEQTMLGDDGVLAGAAPGTVVAVHSTVSPDVCRKLAERCRRRDVRLVDAPVSGAEAGAVAGSLTLLVGGEERDVDACREVFYIVGYRVFHLGPVGAGQVAKICNNLMFTVNLRTALEALQLADAAGLDEHYLREIASVSTAASWALEHIEEMRRLIVADTQSRRAFEIGNKDLALAAELGKSLEIDTPIAEIVGALQQS